MPEYDTGFGPLRGPGDGGTIPKADNALAIPNLALGIDYIKDPKTGLQTAVVTATWDAPTLGEDLGKTTKNKVVEYWVSDRQGTIAHPDLTWNAERKVTVRTVVFRGLNLSTLMDFRVRARTGGGQYGPYASASINTALDTTAPNKPSKPIVKAALRGVTIAWDGLDYLGNAQPNDFDRCEIEVSRVSATSDYQLVGSFPRQGGSHYFNTPDLSARQYWARLRAFDKTGNFSPYSDVGDATSYSFEASLDYEGQDNSVRNASFEDVSTAQNAVPLHWALAGSCLTERKADWSQHNAFSQRLYSASGEAFLWQKFAVLPDKDYVFSAYLNPGGGATYADRTLMAVGSDSNVWVGPAYSSVAFGTPTRIYFSLHTGPNTQEMEIRLYAPSAEARYDAVQWEAGLFPTAFSPQAGEIGFGTVSTDQLGDLAIVSSKIAGEAVDTPHLRANAVTTAKLTVGTLGADVVRNGGFNDASHNAGAHDAAGRPTTATDPTVADGWSIFAGSAQRTAYTAGAAAGDTYMLFTGGSAGAVISDPFPVEQDRYYYLGAHMQGTGMALVICTGVDASVTLTSDNYQATNFNVVDSPTVAVDSAIEINPASLKLLEGQAKIPLGHKWGRIVVVGDSGGKVDQVFCRKVNGSTMITDGGVYTDKVSAHGISADKIVAGTIVAKILIMSPTIEAGTVNAGTINGAYIRAGTIRGSKFETGEWYETRIVMLDAGQKDAIRWYPGGSGPGLGEVFSDTDGDPTTPPVDVGYGSPYDGGIIGEIRGGYMGVVDAYGVHLNANVQIGHENAVIFQTGRRSVSHAAATVRMGRATATVLDGSGNWRAPYSKVPGGAAVNLPIPPTVAVATLGQSTVGGGYAAAGFAVTGWDETYIYGRVLCVVPRYIDVGSYGISGSTHYSPSDSWTYVDSVYLTGSVGTSGYGVALDPPGLGSTFAINYMAECAY